MHLALANKATNKALKHWTQQAAPLSLALGIKGEFVVMGHIHYFQRYSSRENAVTNNTLQLFARIYEQSPTQLANLLSEITVQNVEIGIDINQQQRSSDSVPDGSIEQRSFKILIETKVDSLTVLHSALETAHSYRRTANPDENLNVVRSIQKDSDAYIDTLLCFIHSKASLEIESFKNDVVLAQYCNFLKGIIASLFHEVVEYSTWNNDFRLHESSLLYHLAFNDESEVGYYMRLLPAFDCSQDLRLFLVCNSRKEDSYSFLNEKSTKIEIEFRKPCWQEIESARILRDTLYKVNSVSRLLERLKEGGVDWNPSDDTAEELRQLISSSEVM